MKNSMPVQSIIDFAVQVECALKYGFAHLSDRLQWLIDRDSDDEPDDEEKAENGRQSRLDAKRVIKEALLLKRCYAMGESREDSERYFNESGWYAFRNYPSRLGYDGPLHPEINEELNDAFGKWLEGSIQPSSGEEPHA